MPRLVSVPAGEIGPLSWVRLPSLTLIGRRGGGASGHEHAGGEGQSSHCFLPGYLPLMKAQPVGSAKP